MYLNLKGNYFLMLNIEEHFTDVLVIGNGGAGLRAAIAAKEKEVNVTIVSYGNGATSRITGVNVPIGSNDSIEKYYKDINRTGEKINNRVLSKKMASNSIDIIKDCELMGIQFEKDSNGKHLLRHLSGSSVPRSIYYKDITGEIIQNRLYEFAYKSRIKFYKGTKVIKLLKVDNNVIGAIAVNFEKRILLKLLSKAVIIATGGIGNIYNQSTYPLDINGEGIFLAYDIGTKLVDMEFIQFEPTVIIFPKKIKGKLMPTSLLGDGAVLRNKYLERFFSNYYNCNSEKYMTKKELSFSIAEEVMRGRNTKHGGIYFDSRHLPLEIINGYPDLLKVLSSEGINLLNDLIEVYPAAHSSLGGIFIDEFTRTNINGLFAAGEAAGGVHGADRMAGNAGTEILFFGKLAGEEAANYAIKVSEKFIKKNKSSLDRMIKNFLNANIQESGIILSAQIEKQIRDLISEGAGLLRSEKALKRNIKKIIEIEKTIIPQIKVKEVVDLADIIKIRGMTNIAKIIMIASLTRKESRGFFRRIDYPEIGGSNWQKNIILYKNNDSNIKMEII